MKKLVLLLLGFMVVTTVMAMANDDPYTLFDLQYKMGAADSQGEHKYDFTLLYLGAGGDKLGFLMPGLCFMNPYDPNNPSAGVGSWGKYNRHQDFTVVSWPGPWTWIDQSYGFLNGPIFGDESIFWAPNSGESLDFSVLSHGDLSHTPLWWSHYDELYNLYLQPITYNPTPTPEPGTLTLMGAGLIGAWSLIRRRL